LFQKQNQTSYSKVYLHEKKYN